MIYSVNNGDMVKVYCRGKLMNKVFYVDTKRGIIDRYREPLKVDKRGKRAISERVRCSPSDIAIEEVES